jgi:hypothetical protein
MAARIAELETRIAKGGALKVRGLRKGSRFRSVLGLIAPLDKEYRWKTNESAVIRAP